VKKRKKRRKKKKSVGNKATKRRAWGSCNLRLREREESKATKLASEFGKTRVLHLFASQSVSLCNFLSLFSPLSCFDAFDRSITFPIFFSIHSIISSSFPFQFHFYQLVSSNPFGMPSNLVVARVFLFLLVFTVSHILDQLNR